MTKLIVAFCNFVKAPKKTKTTIIDQKGANFLLQTWGLSFSEHKYQTMKSTVYLKYWVTFPIAVFTFTKGTTRSQLIEVNLD
jgi:hypothetical protein